MSINKPAKKVWNFLWNDDSVWSWIISLVLAFVIIKFIFFPLISLTLATPLPLVVIESGSMHHQDSSLFRTITGIGITSRDSAVSWFDENQNWYLSNNITKEEFLSWRYGWGMDKGDIIVVKGTQPDKLKLGDVIIFNAGQTNPIIHRIVNIKDTNGALHFSTKGDNNPGQLSFEKDISGSQIVGKAVLRIPKVGWVKLFFVSIFRSSIVF